MAQDLQLKIKGLYTSFNDLSEVPEGGLLVAQNIDLLQDSLASARRGFDRLAGAFEAADERALQITEYQEKLVVYTTAAKLYYRSTATWVRIGGTATYSPPDSSTPLRFALANKNLYFTTSLGVYKLDSLTGTPQLSGAFKGLDLSLTVTNTLATWLLDQHRVAYRAVFGYRDANENLILGAPSSRASVKNSSGGGREVTVSVRLPAGITTDYFVQLYRSNQVDNTSATIEPSDEMQLVFERFITSADITAGELDPPVVDITADNLRGATLYTSATQGGLALQNERPPFARDIAVFKGYMFFANVFFVQRYNFTVISAAALANDETITIGGIVYTAKAAEDVAAREFLRATSGGIAENIGDTARSLVRVINGASTSVVYAYYVSDGRDLPGKIGLEARTLGQAAFSLTSNAANAWTSPVLPASGVTEISKNDVAENGLAYSKNLQPESVPLPNREFAGRSDKGTLRIIALKDSLFLLKEDGIYKLYGQSSADFQITEFDRSVRIIAPESAVVIANSIFCLTDQGVVSISETGVSIRSRPIEQDLLELQAGNLAGIRTQAFGLAYEQDRKYYLYLPSSTGDTFPTMSYVYNIFTNTWVMHTFAARCGFVAGDGSYYVGAASSAYLFVENRSYGFRDFADFGFDGTITAIDEVAGVVRLTLGAGIDNVSVGDIIAQGATSFATVTQVDAENSQVVVTSDPGFTVAACIVRYAIDTALQWAPMVTGNVGVQKHFYEAKLTFKVQFSGTGYFTFASDFNAVLESVAIEGGSVGLWGLFPWGMAPWGGDLVRRESRQWVPRAKQRASQLLVGFDHRVGYSPWQLQGVSVYSVPGSGKTVRS